MKHTSPDVDAYIAKSAKFAQPILNKIRRLFHKACPDVQETMKWSFPHFQHQGVLGSMAAYKQHVSFGFWKGKLMENAAPFQVVGKTSMSALKVTSLDELPPDETIISCILEAVRLNEDDIKPAKPKRAVATKSKDVVVPDDLRAALKQNRQAAATFEGFSPSHQREYVDWITEAKQQSTREKRLTTTIEWLAEGKPRHWKYMKSKK